jgi:hypothetical protein
MFDPTATHWFYIRPNYRRGAEGATTLPGHGGGDLRAHARGV